MLVEIKSRFSGKFNSMELDITEQQYERYFYGGEKVQNVFPNLSVEEREFLITGASLEEQAEIFGTGDDE